MINDNSEGHYPLAELGLDWAVLPSISANAEGAAKWFRGECLVAALRHPWHAKDVEFRIIGSILLLLLPTGQQNSEN